MIVTKTQTLHTKHFFWILAFVALGLFLAYAYLVNAAILNVVSRQKAEAQIAKLSSVTSDLEAQYIALEDGISLSMAYSKGFQDANNVAFLTKTTDTTSHLSFR